MARGVNKAILIGNLGADPETRYTASGTAVTNCNIATSETWRDKQSGEKQERTEWHRLVFFARLAEVAGEYLKKGAKIYVEGRIQTRKWQDKDGIDRYSTEIVVGEMQMLDSKGANSGQGSAPYGGGQSQRPPQQNSGAQNYRNASQGGGPARQNQPQAPANPMGPGFDDDLDDDIPF